LIALPVKPTLAAMAQKGVLSWEPLAGGAFILCKCLLFKKVQMFNKFVALTMCCCCGPGSGIFMSIVFLLGSKTNFGGSEQNPAFWIQLLLAANRKKQYAVTCKWFDPKKDEEVSRKLILGDWQIWVRFIMSFLVNGVGFHILIHSLPIQVAGQSTLCKCIALHTIQLWSVLLVHFHVTLLIL
jgi:hypothetical protein